MLVTNQIFITLTILRRSVQQVAEFIVYLRVLAPMQHSFELRRNIAEVPRGCHSKTKYFRRNIDTIPNITYLLNLLFYFLLPPWQFLIFPKQFEFVQDPIRVETVSTLILPCNKTKIEL